MDKYLKNNYSFWQYGYTAPNVENVIFRLHGRILKYKYKLPHVKKPTVTLDFGCGQGAIVNYFHQQGYDAYGIDISKTDIEIAKNLLRQNIDLQIISASTGLSIYEIKQLKS